MARTITRKTKRKAKERPKDVQPARTKKGRDLVPLVVGSSFTYSPFDVACMQIMKFNNNRRFNTNISYQHNFLFYSKSLNMLKNNINMLPEKLNVERQG
jgi:hypothetical protein